MEGVQGRLVQVHGLVLTITPAACLLTASIVREVIHNMIKLISNNSNNNNKAV